MNDYPEGLMAMEDFGRILFNYLNSVNFTNDLYLFTEYQWVDGIPKERLFVKLNPDISAD